jgi:phage baseplate assembly protein W
MSELIINDRKISDVNLSFIPDPNTGDILKLNSFAVIRRSLQNIFFTRVLEKPFREDLGSPLPNFLFDVAGASDIPVIETIIVNTIERFEPRIGVRSLVVEPDFSNNRLEVTIEYVIKSTQREDVFTTFLNLSE